MTALYVAAEFAAVSVRRSRIRQMAEDGDATAQRLLPILEDASALDRYIAACQVGITLGSLILGAYGQIAFGPGLAGLLQERAGLDPIAASSAAAVVILLVLTVGTMVAGELAPKSLALEYPTRDRALHVLADALVALAARPLHLVPERLRHARPAPARQRARRPPPRALAGRDRAADRREPRRRPARTRRTAAPAARAAFQPAHRGAVDDHARPDAGHRRDHAGRAGAGAGARIVAGQRARLPRHARHGGRLPEHEAPAGAPRRGASGAVAARAARSRRSPSTSP